MRHPFAFGGPEAAPLSQAKPSQAKPSPIQTVWSAAHTCDMKCWHFYHVTNDSTVMDARHFTSIPLSSLIPIRFHRTELCANVAGDNSPSPPHTHTQQTNDAYKTKNYIAVNKVCIAFHFNKSSYMRLQQIHHVSSDGVVVATMFVNVCVVCFKSIT